MGRGPSGKRLPVLGAVPAGSSAGALGTSAFWASGSPDGRVPGARFRPPTVTHTPSPAWPGPDRVRPHSGDPAGDTVTPAGSLGAGCYANRDQRTRPAGREPRAHGKADKEWRLCSWSEQARPWLPACTERGPASEWAPASETHSEGELWKVAV